MIGGAKLFIILKSSIINSFSANPTKWSNTFKKFVGFKKHLNKWAVTKSGFYYRLTLF